MTVTSDMQLSSKTLKDIANEIHERVFNDEGLTAANIDKEMQIFQCEKLASVMESMS